MKILCSKKLPALLAALVVGGTVVAVALPGVLTQQVINDTNSVRFRVIRTVADGFDSGWHVHPGIAIVQVQEGAFQVYQGSCTPRTVAAGDTYIEVPHLPVRAVATGRIVWTTTQITNGGDPPQIPLSAYSPQQPNPGPGT